MQGLVALTGVQCASAISLSRCVQWNNSVRTCCRKDSLLIAVSNRNSRNANKREVPQDVGCFFSLTRRSLLTRSTSHFKVFAASAEDEAVNESHGELLKLLSHPDVANNLQITKVRFMLQKECLFGQQFKVVGEDALLGAWDSNAAVSLEWTDGHIWTQELDVPVGKIYEYKYLLTGKHGKVEWQPGSNRFFETLDNSSLLIVSEPWITEEPSSQNVSEDQLTNANFVGDNLDASTTYPVMPNSLATEASITHVEVNVPTEPLNGKINAKKVIHEEYQDKTWPSFPLDEVHIEQFSVSNKCNEHVDLPTMVAEVSREVSEDVEGTTVNDI